MKRPTPRETILSVHDSGLDVKLVKFQLENQRKQCEKRGEDMLMTRNRPMDPNPATRMWRVIRVFLGLMRGRRVYCHI